MEDGRWKKMRGVLPGDARAVVIVASSNQGGGISLLEG